jgi:hypothetical protein
MRDSQMVSAANWRTCFGYCAERFRVQFHQDSPDTADQPSDGRWRQGSAVERGRPSSPLGSLRAAEDGKSGSVKETIGKMSCLVGLVSQVVAWVSYPERPTLTRPLLVVSAACIAICMVSLYSRGKVSK